jgi:cell pole-organizing protein PopZ
LYLETRTIRDNMDRLHQYCRCIEGLIETHQKAPQARRVPLPPLNSKMPSTAAVDTAFNTLAQAVKKHEPTLEDVVRETLRPMLKSWLDENFPAVVERMVQAEIERVARGR